MKCSQKYSVMLPNINMLHSHPDAHALVVPARGLEAQAKVTVSFANDNSQPQGINDGVEPKSSGEQPSALCHWWPHKGTEEWAQYTWKKPVQVRSEERRVGKEW